HVHAGARSDLYPLSLHDALPIFTERLASARLVSKFHVARDFAYDCTHAAGDGWLLVGDAWGFLDPLFSSGVLFALKSGEMAADRSEEHTSELQSRENLVCRLLPE